LQKIKKLGRRNGISIVLALVALVAIASPFYVMGLFGREWFWLLITPIFFLQFSKLKFRFKVLIFALLILVVTMIFCLHFLFRAVHEFNDPITSRRFVVIEHFGSHAIYHERSGIFLHSTQRLNLQNSEFAPRSVIIDADGLSMEAGIDSVSFPLQEELHWVELPISEIIIGRRWEDEREFVILTRNPIRNTTELIFTDDVRNRQSTRITITDAQYQEIRRLLSEAPLANRGQTETPFYWMSVVAEEGRGRTRIYIQGSDVLNELVFLKG